MPYTPEEAQELIRELTGQQRKLSYEESTVYSRVEKADKVIRLAWFVLGGFGIGIVAVTAFYIHTNTAFGDAEKRFVAHEEMFRLREARITSLEQLHQASLMTDVARLSLSEALRKDVDKIEKRVDAIEPQNRTMFEMLKRGESNKDAFYIEFGRQPPSFIPPGKGEVGGG